MKPWKVTLVGVVAIVSVLVFVVTGLSGCAAQQAQAQAINDVSQNLESLAAQAEGAGATTKLADAFLTPLSEALTQLQATLADQGVLNDWMTRMSANSQDPRIEVGLQAELTAFIGVGGVNGRFETEGAGGGTQLPKDVREALIAELQEPNVSDARRTALLEILGWNRTESTSSDGE